MKDIVYSVIVPVYNVERYLRECIDSVLRQQSKYPYEVILVDDGSTDSSGEICDEYASDERVKIVHQSNAGVSAARNRGIAVSRGRRLLFVDGDDCWEQNTLSALDEYVETGADTLLFAHSLWEEGKKTPQALYYLCQGKGGEEYLDELFKRGLFPAQAVWSYAFDAKILKERELAFDERLKVCEDFDLIMRYLPHSRFLATINSPLYLYRQREGSVMKTVSVEKLQMSLEGKAKWYYRYPHPTMANLWAYEIFLAARLQSKKDKKAAAKIIKSHKEILKQATENPLVRLRRVVKVFGVYNALRIYGFLRKFLNKGKERGKVCGTEKERR